MKAVILAGGVGTRMRPLTYLVPKSMLPLGGKPLLERSIQYLKEWGIREVVICVAYLKNQILEHFKDGSAFNVKVQYAEADMPLGTAGQLKTAERSVSDTFLAMNGDIITSLNIGRLVDFHRKAGGIATIALKKFQVKIPYGHVAVDLDSRITKFEEKPSLSYLANAGVYILEPQIFDHIASGLTVSLETEIFPQLIEKGQRLYSYLEDAYWADVGAIREFERVDNELLTQYYTNSNRHSREKNDRQEGQVAPATHWIGERASNE